MATTEQLQDLIDLQSGNTPLSTLRLLAQAGDFSIHSSVATNGTRYNLQDAIKKVGITEETTDVVDQIEEYKEQQHIQRKEEYNNRPILPFTGSDSYEISTIVRNYGGTIGNPIVEGTQTIVNISIWNDNENNCNINFYNKDELNVFIQELQDAMKRYQ